MHIDAVPRTLVWLGPPFFSAHLRELGWHVIVAPHELSSPRTFTDIMQLTGGVTPDVVLVADASTPPLVIDTEFFPCLTVFYAIDSHVHSWYPLYAQGFDLCLVSLKDHLPLFTAGRLTEEAVHWFPPYALDQHRPIPLTPQIWDLIFVGTVNAERSPKRYAFITALQEVIPSLHVETARSFPTLYPQAKLILNESSQGDLNFRVFEALGCGGCLLTPYVENGLTDLFTHGQELFIYPPYDVDAVCALVSSLLANEDLRHRVAAAGLAVVDGGHRASHRAKQLHDRITELFSSQKAEQLITERLRIAPQLHNQALRLLYLHHAETVTIESLRKTYLAVGKRRGQDLTYATNSAQN